MKGSILIFCSFCCLTIGYAQSGYLGKKNGLDLRLSVGPSYRQFNKIDEFDHSVQRMKMATTSYSLSYSRVLTRNFELSVGYQFANIQCSVEDRLFNRNIDIETDYGFGTFEKSLLDEPRIKYNGGVIGFNFFRLGSIAPIGKYVGFSLSFGRIVFDSTTAIVVGDRDDDITNTIFKAVYEYDNPDSVSLERTVVNNWNLKARFGRNYPLTDFLMLSVGMSFPIFSSYKSDYTTQFGFQLREVYRIDQYGDWKQYFMTSVKSYHRVTFDIGLKFLL